MTETNIAPPSTKATSREWLALVVLVMPTLLVSMDMTVTYLALPAISAALRPTSVQLLWITDIYSFVDASLLIVMGTLGDRFGLKKLLLIGGAGFAAASALAAFSTSAIMLIVARGLLGIAGATLLTATISIIRNIFKDDRQRTFALGLYTTCFSAGTMLGPFVGGVLLSHFWWGSVFLIALPLMVLLLLLAPFLLPEFKDEKAGSLDLLSAGLLIAAILLIISGVKQIAQNGFDYMPAVSIAAGLATGAIFLRRQVLLQHPLLDRALFKKASFNTALAALFIGLFSWGGIFLFVGQYLQAVLGLTSLQAGLWMMPGACGSIVLCMLAPIGLRFARRGTLMAAGLFTLATGIALIAFVTQTSLLLLVIATVLMSGGCGVTVTLGIDMVVSSAPPEKAGVAAGISETSTGLGVAFGIALLGSLWTAVYRNNINANMPAGLGPADAENVRSTLGGAVAVAQKLGGQAQASLVNSAREAFVHSLNITAGACAAVVLAVAIAVAIKLKKA